MNTVHQIDSGEHPAPAPHNRHEPTLDDLSVGVRELYGESTAQLRDIGELAFMELELAIRSLQWGLWALFMFGACSVMTATFLMMTVVLVLVKSSVPPAAAMLVCGVFSATAALFLFLGLRSMTRRMAFRNLRGHMTQMQDAAHVGS